MEGFLQKTNSGYHIFTEKCAKNNKKVKGHVYAFPVVYTTVKLVQQLQIIFRLVLCIAHRCDCNKRNKDPVCTYCIRCKTHGSTTESLDSIATRCTSMSKIVQKCLLGLVDLGSTMEKGIEWTSRCLGLATSGFWVSISIMINILVCITIAPIGRQWVSMILYIFIWQKKISKGMLQFCLDSHIFSNYYQTFLFGVPKLGHTSCLVLCKKKLQGGSTNF